MRLLRREKKSKSVWDTVEEFMELAKAERGIDAIFWALTDEGDVVASELFKIWKNEGLAVAQVHTEGVASRWRVVAEAIDFDHTQEWDDRTPIHAEPGDIIKFNFKLHVSML